MSESRRCHPGFGRRPRAAAVFFSVFRAAEPFVVNIRGRPAADLGCIFAGRVGRPEAGALTTGPAQAHAGTSVQNALW